MSETASLCETFNQYFRIVFADTPELVRQVYRIRYDVYCRELQFESGDRFPNQEEQDGYDLYSRYCLLYHRPSKSYIGCVRIVLGSSDNPERLLPLEEMCKTSLYQDMLAPLHQHRSSICEASRLAVLASFRRRTGEQSVPIGIADGNQSSGMERRSSFPHIALGLYLASFVLASSIGIKNLFALMEPRLARRLQYYGFSFTKIGDVVELHGKRAPYCIDVDILMASLRGDMQQLRQVIQNSL